MEKREFLHLFYFLMLRNKNQWRDIYVAVAPQKPEN